MMFQFVAPQWDERRERLQEYCQTQPLSLPKPRQLRDDESRLPANVKQHFTNIYNKQVMFNIVHVPKLNLNWCLVPKVASTSISKLILPFLDQGSQATGRFPHLQREVWARAGHLSYQHYLEKINSTTTFLISRHPFARVASAFRNKLENRGQSHDGEYFYNIYSRQIIK